MRKEIIFIICLMLSSCLLKAQNLSSSLNSKLPKPSISNSISALPSKPEIPYLEELKQIQSLKKSYDSLRREIKNLKEITSDSIQPDSLFTPPECSIGIMFNGALTRCTPCSGRV